MSRLSLPPDYTEHPIVAFRNDARAIEAKVGPIRSHGKLEAAILDGRVASITPAGHWLVAWFAGNTDQIEALEFLPVDYCKERWPIAADIDGVATIAVYAPGPYVMVQPAPENAS